MSSRLQKFRVFTVDRKKLVGIFTADLSVGYAINLTIDGETNIFLDRIRNGNFVNDKYIAEVIKNDDDNNDDISVSKIRSELEDNGLIGKVDFLIEQEIIERDKENTRLFYDKWIGEEFTLQDYLGCVKYRDAIPFSKLVDVYNKQIIYYKNIIDKIENENKEYKSGFYGSLDVIKILQKKLESLEESFKDIIDTDED